MPEYRLDDLARAAGTTTRNVRAYAERGLLPPPRRAGRTNVYDDTHLARLRLIGRLLERGYTVAHISEFIRTWEGGRDLGQTLGLEAALLAPASGELPQELDESEVAELFGGTADPESIERAIELGLLTRLDGGFRVHRPRLLRAGAELLGIGLPLPQVLDLAARMRAQVRAVADTFVEAVAGQIVGQHPADWRPTDEEVPALVALVERLRPLARVTVDTELAEALDRAIQDYVGEWLAALAARVDAPPAAG